MDVQFEWNNIQFTAKETDYPHRKMWLAINSAIIKNIWNQIV